MKETRLEKKLQRAAAVLAAVVFFSGSVFAGEVDKLAQKLAEKGVISYGEAQQIITETAEETRQLTASGANSLIPAWIQNVKFNADIRLRFQSDWNSSDNTRDRERLRLRFGFEARPVENLSAAFGLATGKTSGGADSEPTSTNYTFQGFGKAPIFVDYAYLQYDIAGMFKVNAGKLKAAMVTWNIKQLIWDTDINPEGVTVNFNRDLGGGLAIFGNAGWIFLNGDIRQGAGQPETYIFQPGITFSKGKISLKAALGYQQFVTKGRNLFSTPGNANFLGGYTSSTNFSLINPGIEFKAKEVVGKYTIKVFSEYVKNIDDEVYKDNNEGGLFGFTFGDDKIEKLGDWNIGYAARYLMARAIPAYLGFSDAYGGAGNARGYEIGFNLGLTKKASLAISYLNYDVINGAENNKSLAQFDVSYKF
ncbi:MAG: putative porin [Endomicrobium sp.]|jgi:hypothetical protein|nr:putative porin [Endomicrobium sp.]